MKTLIILIFSIVAINVNAQNILLSESPAEDTIIPVKGPNLKRFHYIYVGYETFADNFTSDSASIKYGLSSRLFFGYKFKRKITNYFAVGYDISMLTSIFSLKQNSKKIFPSNIVHEKERMEIGGIGLHLFTRFNFDRRGNKIGKYIDIGAYANWDYATSHFTKDKVVAADSINAKTIRVTESRLSYIENYEYGIRISLGSNHVEISATYRVSDLIKSKYVNYPELPRLSIGISLALF